MSAEEASSEQKQHQMSMGRVGVVEWWSGGVGVLE